MFFLLLWSLSQNPICSSPLSQEPGPAVRETPLAVLKREARAVEPLVTARLAKDFLFVRSLHQALKPGGQVLIYNISPAPSPTGQPYKNWADGRCPFSKKVWEEAGFRVVAFDQDDSEAARAIGHALGWDQGDSPIDLKSDIFAKYSLMEKPKGT